MSLVHSIGRLLFFQSSDRESLLVEKVGALFVSRYTTRGWIFEGRQSRHLLEVAPGAQWMLPEEYPGRSWRCLASSPEYVGSSSEPVVSKRAPRVAA